MPTHPSEQPPDVSQTPHLETAPMPPIPPIPLMPGAPGESATLGGWLTQRDGTMLHWRAIHTDDAPRLQAFHRRLSHHTLVFRFYGELPELSRELAERLSHVDCGQRMAMVATVGEGMNEAIVAVARYECTDPGEAEFALVVEDRLQGQGIGPQLLRLLADYARRHGFTVFIANVMYDNEHMLAMLRHLGLPAIHHLHEGRVEVRLDISGLDEQSRVDHGPASRADP